MIRRWLACLTAAVWFGCCHGNGNVGCLFSERLCDDVMEWCFDDYAFGRCLSLYGIVQEEDIYRHDLSRPDLHALEREMERLFSLGYRWSHSYTQCVLQALLHSFRYGLDHEPGSCNTLVDQDLEAALKALEGDEEVDPRDLAYVKFTPSASNPHAEYADEVYLPALQEELEREPPEVNVVAVDEYPSYYPIPYSYNSQVSKKSGPEANLFQRRYNTPESFREGVEVRDEKREHGPSSDDLRRLAMLLYDVQNEEEGAHGDTVRSETVSPVYTEGGLVFLPNAARTGKPDEGGENMRDFLMLRNRKFSRGPAGDDDQLSLDLDDNLDDLLNDYDSLDWGFKRRERLDVKKPGPYFKINNYAFDNEENLVQEQKRPTSHHMGSRFKPAEQREFSVERSVPDVNRVSSTGNGGAEASNTSDAAASSSVTPGEDAQTDAVVRDKKVVPLLDDEDLTPQPYDVVDTSYAYLGFKDSIGSWAEGAEIVKLVADLLHLKRDTFYNFRIDKNMVTFKVRPNEQGLNASEVSRRVDNVKDKIKSEIGIEVTSTGIGDKTKLPTVLSLDNSDHQLYIATFLLCGVVAAVLVGAAVLYVIKRHARSREKLQNLSQPDTEASKDYQDLCRARMANKTQEKPEPIHVAQKIASLSRESEGSNNSPSSRSSTSSWSEEPVLTNMDISTGHMVLSYMEDHLKNKDRLDQEWVALCAYEAEPCACNVAQKAENMKKNRYPDVLPYDHCRVVLNDLANISGGDFVNASTITDHDPRNPAYIATQGPLPQTSADFWQMVWEQGSVVIVMLTRLTENGTAMCHRYWPEEGSELYHIYEVHLVSEHIWCDDYLVRSFYLKNLKTGETRTVTQFHFLSWPDNGVPHSTKALLEFRRKVNKSYRGRSCPIAIHCSDGIGRSGTYTLIDMVLNRMAKGAKEIDIAATLEHIRDQRANMVKTKQQFEFVLMAVAEEVHAILKALPQ